ADQFLPILGMDRFRPGIAEGLVFAPAGKRVPGLADEGALAVDIGDPDHDGRTVRHLPETVLALPQRRLGSPAFGDLLLRRLIEAGTVGSVGRHSASSPSGG